MAGGSLTDQVLSVSVSRSWESALILGLAAQNKALQ